MDQPFRNRSRSRPGLQYRAPPAVIVFSAIAVVLSLLGKSSPELSKDLVLSADKLTTEGFFASHLYHAYGYHLILVVLLMFSAGGVLESQWGTPRFVVFYLFTMSGSVLVTVATAALLQTKEPTCGAAGVSIGALVGAGYLYPEYRLARYAPAAKHLAWMMVFLAGAVLAFLHTSEGLFLFPQVSGAGFAVLFLALEPWSRRLMTHWKARRRELRMKQVVAIRHKVEDLLAKISEEGYESLTRDEKSFLREASRHYRTE
jgi:membrane associated rhomboid family serine protease